MKIIIFGLLIAASFLLTGFSSNKPFLYHKFYQYQTYDLFVTSVRENLEGPLNSEVEPKCSYGTPAGAKADLRKCLRDLMYERVKNMTLFEALVFKNHPEYIAPYLAMYSKMSLYEKAAFLRALLSLGIWPGEEIMIDNAKLYEWVTDPQLTHISWVDDYTLQNDKDIDGILDCYCATGNESYVINVVEYVQKRMLESNNERLNCRLKLYINSDPVLKEKVMMLIFSNPKFEALRMEFFPG